MNGAPDLDAAGSACRNAQIELDEMMNALRELRFRRQRFDLRAGYGAVFTNLTLALHHMECARDNLREAADGFYAQNPDAFWVDADGKTHYIDDEEESE